MVHGKGKKEAGYGMRGIRGKGEGELKGRAPEESGRGMVFEKETYRILGACFEVYKERGCGFLEAVYHECLAIELERRGIPFASKPPLRLEYKGMRLTTAYEPDLLCFGLVVVELKAVRKLTDKHRAQTINYLHAAAKQVGLLVNFGHFPLLEHERFVNLPFPGVPCVP